MRRYFAMLVFAITALVMVGCDYYDNAPSAQAGPPVPTCPPWCP